MYIFSTIPYIDAYNYYLFRSIYKFFHINNIKLIRLNLRTPNPIVRTLLQRHLLTS